MGAPVTLRDPKAVPCVACPFRVSNRGKPPSEHETEGAYDRATRSALWFRSGGVADPPVVTDTGINSGAGLVCHRRRTPKSRLAVNANECTSTRVLQERELLRYVEHGPPVDADPLGYQRGAGLTERGRCLVAAKMLGRPVTRAELAGLDVAELLAGAHPALLDPDVGLEEVRPLTRSEVERWGGLRDTVRQAA